MITVTIPIYKSTTEWFEQISFEQCLRVLKKHPISLVTFKELEIDYFIEILNKHSINYSVEYFDKKYFDSVIGYNQLLTSRKFYTRFRKSEYILIYQLDAFVLEDYLENWANMGFSYVGAPWLRIQDGTLIYTGVGNGGFSLRKIKDHIKATTSFAYIESPKQIFYRYFMTRRELLDYFKLIFSFLKKISVTNNTFHLFNDYTYNEDVFWCHAVASSCNWYTLADTSIAKKFAFEMYPEFLYKENNNILPFGCHAWHRYGTSFWKPIIESFGYTYPEKANHE